MSQSWPRVRANLLTVILASLLVAATLLVPTGKPAHAADGYNRGLWIATDAGISEWEIRRAAGKVNVVVFNSDQQWKANLLRSLDPTVTILAYMDLSSVRKFYPDSTAVSGVSYNQAANNGWLARDTWGNTIEWNGYPGHYQAKVWDQAYRDAWTRGVVQTISASPWNGVFADNDMMSLRWYSPRPLQWTNSMEQTDQLIRDSLDQLITTAGTAVNARGKAFVVNISEGRLYPQRWAAHSRFGGGNAEHFMSWSQNWNPDIWDYGRGGWSDEGASIASGPRSMAITTAARGDRRTCVYGYASFLLWANWGDVWQCAPGNITRDPLVIPESQLQIGAPRGTASKQGAAWARTFENGWVAVNPTNSWVSVSVPSGYRTADWSWPSTISLQPRSGAVLTR